MNKLFVLPYKKGSKSAKALAKAIGAKQIKLVDSKYKPYPTHTVINWGCSSDNSPAHVIGAKFLNTPVAVAHAANKLKSFQMFEAADIPTVPWCTDHMKAEEWLEDGKTVVCRTKLTGHSGEGIVICDQDNNAPLVRAKLYTQYVKKKDEYRIHVFEGTIITQQRKARKLDVPNDEVDWKVRNLAGGFIFARNEGKAVPQCVLDVAPKAIEALMLDFGAVDIIYNAHEDKAYVLEVNTACGLEGETLEEYVNAIKNR